VERERLELERIRRKEKEETCALLPASRASTQATADALAEAQSSDPEAMLRLLTTEELGGAAHEPAIPARRRSLRASPPARAPFIPSFPSSS